MAAHVMGVVFSALCALTNLLGRTNLLGLPTQTLLGRTNLHNMLHLFEKPRIATALKRMLATKCAGKWSAQGLRREIRRSRRDLTIRGLGTADHLEFAGKWTGNEGY